MKRKGKLYQRIISLENLAIADRKARLGKHKQYGVKAHVANEESNLQELHLMLKNKAYKTSEYKTFQVFEPKERTVYRLPFYPDRIVHHAIMNVLESIFVATYTSDTFSCIKGRGIHSLSYKVRKSLNDIPGTKYCLKIDIKKFYPNVDHEVLKGFLIRKFKDKDLLWLLFEIIDSTEGLPIGNYLSQHLSNFYLSPLDHLIKEQLEVKYYFRYADDMVLLSGSKSYLHEKLAQIRAFLKDVLKLDLKGNYQIFAVDDRGLDLVGYKHYRTHVLLRKRIKQNFARMLKKRPNKASIASYKGWAKHANTKHLLKKLLHDQKI